MARGNRLKQRPSGNAVLFRAASAVCWILLLTNCASRSERIDHLAQQSGFSKSIVQGESFRHLVYRNGIASNSLPLHVYIEGDGTPWLRATRIADDPTPRRPVMLELMRQDTGPALYLGRPCYFGLTDAACTPLIWTHERYSKAVVSSMAKVLRKQLAVRNPFSPLILLGYSGGGTLATLLAAQLAETCAVVTLAGNLDIQAWAERHRYTPMQGSLNPLDQPPLPASIHQWHYYGTQDDNVPYPLLVHYFDRHPGAEAIPVADYDHHCCWAKLWPSILQRLARLNCSNTS